MEEDLDDFIVETTEMIEKVNDDLIDLEAIPNPETINRIFRAFRTIKGTCGSLGFSQSKDVAHWAWWLVHSPPKVPLLPWRPWIEGQWILYQRPNLWESMALIINEFNMAIQYRDVTSQHLQQVSQIEDAIQARMQKLIRALQEIGEKMRPSGKSLSTMLMSLMPKMRLTPPTPSAGIMPFLGTRSTHYLVTSCFY